MPEKLVSADLKADLEKLRDWALAPAETQDGLIQNLTGVYHALIDIDLARYDTTALKDDAPALMLDLFRTRMQLRDRIPDLAAKGFLTPQMQRAMRDLFRAMRYAGDMLGELGGGFRRFTEDDRPMRAFSGRHANTLFNPRFDEKRDLPFQSGDIILVRGCQHNSAAIARIGDIDSQFSHVCIVYIDPKGLHWAIEVLIEEGGVIKPLDEALQHSLGRAIVFRYRDPVLAQRAAFIAHEHVKQSLSRYGKPILYDFTMQNSNYKRLFCSKLIRLAFDKASEGKTMLSTFPSHLKMTNRDFFARIGVTAEETFAPGDMELEPDFDIVAEWQDYRLTPSLRHQDMVMDKVFEWMDTHQLKFKETFLINMISLFGRVSAGFSNTIKSMIADVVPKVPPHMRRQTIATIVMLHKSAEPIVQELSELERERIALFGHPLHPREIQEYLERLRVKSHNEVGYLVPAGQLPAM